MFAVAVMVTMGSEFDCQRLANPLVTFDHTPPVSLQKEPASGSLLEYVTVYTFCAFAPSVKIISNEAIREVIFLMM